MRVHFHGHGTSITWKSFITNRLYIRVTIKCSLVYVFCQPIWHLSTSAFKSTIVNPSATANRNSKTKIRTETYARFKFHCRTSGNLITKLRIETCARSYFHCRTSGNLTTKLGTKTCARSNFHCRTSGNLTTKLGTKTCARSNFHCRIGWNLTTKLSTET